jgi:hypothetical protein
MRRYSFRILSGGVPLPDTTSMLPHAAAAQKEALTICADLAKDIVLHLADKSSWQITAADRFTGERYRRIARLSRLCQRPSFTRTTPHPPA